jgi:uncharacterized membrane protein
VFTPFREAALLDHRAHHQHERHCRQRKWSGRSLLITTWREVAPGGRGAVSMEGTGAGLAWAFVMSALGATLEADHIPDNDVFTFVNTFVAVCSGRSTRAESDCEVLHFMIDAT